MKDVQYQTLKGHDHKVRLTFNDVGHGAMVYLIIFKDTNVFYVGSSNSGDDRIQGHITHEKSSNGKPNPTYHEALKNYDIEIRTLRKCNSMSEAEYWETIFIREYKKILGDRLLNIKK